MTLQDQNGQFVELQIADYQFPDSPVPSTKYSWLNVQGAASNTRGEWTFSSPALTVDEGPYIGRWLQSVIEKTRSGEPLTSRMRLELTEPNIDFEVMELSPTSVRLNIGLAMSFAAPWKVDFVRAGLSRESVEITIDVDALEREVEAWLANCDEFPDRYDPVTMLELPEPPKRSSS